MLNQEPFPGLYEDPIEKSKGLGKTDFVQDFSGEGSDRLRKSKSDSNILNMERA